MTEAEVLDIMLGKLPKSKPQEYPQTDISYDEQKVVYVEIAVPGYTKESLKIDIQDDNLVITGNISEDSLDSLASITFIQRKIEIKEFTRKVHLDPQYINGEFYADLNDGILTISIKPKENPKVNITIN